MKIILLRHAIRRRQGGEDRYLALDSQGESDAVKQGRELFNRKIIPEVYFTSWFAHAKQTADILQKTVSDLHEAGGDFNLNPKVVELCTLTPQFPGRAVWAGPQNWAGINILEWIRSEAEYTGNDLRKLGVAVFVLHDPRIRQLLEGMTSGKYSQLMFKYSEGICLSADSLDAFLEGKGEQDGSPLRQTGSGA